MIRKESLETGEIYHLYTKSIANFKIFNDENEFGRMKCALRYYQLKNIPQKLSQFILLCGVKDKGFNKYLFSMHADKENLVNIIAYCLMPTHIHIIAEQLMENGISIFMGNLLNSYTRYFNARHKRTGPLWEGRFKSVLVKNDSYFIHLTRYIHLNPVTGYLVNKPEKWGASSYMEYITEVEHDDRICKFDKILDIDPREYKEFVDDRISYQRELAKIRKSVFFEPSATSGVVGGYI